ncbi:SigB/SigF/SigG family RNA polymerase sigma factor [Mycobacterium sp. 236(2023)]|uniref:SigB/SigF/SigG family RNA polymerase sigma factor n=1 Tax=Mycobacterium sp. 236(2023) TaxID=3038163 RepID=UPI0024154470|nr:SigB/SigF/SigG family RNA polymerase sigma factor [Mycobacterium sp. 236(2023)]MDG4669199.1 SigB/SigF/SigG family RNA polymerase sigma factor [Mycobacterium sp. 236(2023)]
MTTLQERMPERTASRSRDGYDDVIEMFHDLALLEDGSPAFNRQRERIIERCLPLADHIARRFRGRGEAHDDLVQVARVGLLNAVNRFDVDAANDFLAFAVPTMMGEVRRYFRDHGWSLKVPRRLKELNVRLNSARAELTQQLNRAPTPSELAAHLGMDREEIVEGLVAANAYSTRSTEQATLLSGEGEGLSLQDTFGELDTNIQRVIDVQTVHPLLAGLPERDRLVLKLRFFDDKTQTQIAEQIGVSQMHVSRLLARALETLRNQVGQ